MARIPSDSKAHNFNDNSANGKSITFRKSNQAYHFLFLVEIWLWKCIPPLLKQQYFLLQRPVHKVPAHSLSLVSRDYSMHFTDKKLGLREGNFTVSE